jgi:galactitol-specific phosphotransferase system IIC component
MLHFHSQNTVALWNAVKITKTTDLDMYEVWQKSDVTTTAY